jgi:hypothetical protein
MPQYPYYIAITYTGRLAGQAPAEIAYVPSLRNQWDSGGFGTGKKVDRELTSPNLQELLDQLMQQGVNWRYDDVDLYVVSAPNRPRQKLNSRDVMEILRAP